MMGDVGTMQNTASTGPSSRKRKSYSCSECRRRKKHCDRRVPGCSQCRLRGETHLCKWGDERDDEEASSSPPAMRSRRLVGAEEPASSSTAAIPSSTTEADESTNLLDALSQADAQTTYSGKFVSPMQQQQSPAEKPIFSEANSSLSSRTSVVGPFESKGRAKLSCDGARHLFYAFRDHMDHLVPIDEEALWQAIGQAESNDVHEIRKKQPDVYALLLFVCASTLILLPPTYSIALGLLSKSEEVGSVLDAWQADAFDAIEEMDMFSQPTMIGIQALVLYQLSLAHRVPGRVHTKLMDELIRMSRRMGLDRLGSAQDDEAIWLEEDLRQCATPSSLPASVGGLWAADTLIKREKKARNLGRAMWSFLFAKDTAASRLTGSCMIDPHSFNTVHPTPYSQGGGTTESEALAWSFMMSIASLTYKYFEICASAQALGRRIDYDEVLKMDAEIMGELQRRPDWLRPEKSGNKDDVNYQHRFKAVLISCSLWHRMFALHRPFLALSRSEPERYGLSSSRSFDYALLTLRSIRESIQKGMLMMRQLGLHYRVLQAALVVITHLFLSSDGMTVSDNIEIHQDLHFAISTLKNLDSADAGGFFYGQGERLERLLATAARIKMTKRQGQSRCLLRDPDQWRPFHSLDEEPSSPSSNFLSTFLANEDAFSNLDQQLLKLTQAGPLPSQGDSGLEDVWKDIFSVLDTSVTAA